MGWNKSKIAITAAVVVLLGIAPTIWIVKKIERHYLDKKVWDAINKAFKTHNGREVMALPNVASLRRGEFGRRFDNFYASDHGDDLMIGLGMPSSGVFGHAYSFYRTRIANPDLLPPGKYDFFVKWPGRSAAALQDEIARVWGLTAKTNIFKTNVFLLTVANPNAPGLKLGGTLPKDNKRDAEFTLRNAPLTNILWKLEMELKTPIVNQTDLTNRYDFIFKWDQYAHDPAVLTNGVLNQLGLALTPSREFIDMLYLEKVR